MALEDLARLEAEARELYRQLAPTADPQARYEGRDLTGAVGVVVDASGVVREVRIQDDWRSRLPGGELGGAVQQATLAAATARLAAWGGAVAGNPDGSPEPPGGPPQPPRSELVRSMADAAKAVARMSDERLLEGLLAVLERFEAEIDTVSQQLAARAAQVHTGRSRGGFATAELTGAGEVVGVSYDQAWLDRADASAIRRETSEAFDEAYRLVARHGVGQLLAESPLGEAQRLATDPMALARTLGIWT